MAINRGWTRLHGVGTAALGERARVVDCASARAVVPLVMHGEATSPHFAYHDYGTRVDASSEYQDYRSRRSGDGCSRHACRWVRQRRDLYADAHAFADAQCHVASG
jgi:hypothetical protein